MNRYEEIEKSLRYIRKMVLANKIKLYHYLLSEDDVAADRIESVNTGLVIGLGELYNLLSPKDQDEASIYDEREKELNQELKVVYEKWLST